MKYNIPVFGGHDVTLMECAQTSKCPAHSTHTLLSFLWEVFPSQQLLLPFLGQIFSVTQLFRHFSLFLYVNVQLFLNHSLLLSLNLSLYLFLSLHCSFEIEVGKNLLNGRKVFHIVTRSIQK